MNIVFGERSAELVSRGGAADPIGLRLHLLGPVEASLTGREVRLPRTPKLRAVLALLALAAPRTVSRARIADLLWSRSPESRVNLRQVLHELGKILAACPQPILQTDREYAGLTNVWVDASVVANSAGAVDDKALALLARGPLLDGLDGLDPAWDGYLASERARHAACVDAAIGSRLEEAANDTALARRLLAIDGSHEGAWRALMAAHIAAGEPAVALRAYKDCEAALGRQLDISPSAETRRLMEAARSLTLAPQQRAQREQSQRRMGARIAVLPPKAVGQNVPSYLPEAIAEFLASSLARFRWLTVLSSFTAVPMADSLRRSDGPAEELELDYLLDGMLMLRSGGRLSLTLQLIDVTTRGEIGWTHRVDGNGDHPEQHLLEEVAERVVAEIDPAILLVEHRRASRTTVRSSYNFLMRAIPLLYRLQPETHRQAGELLRQAIAADPESAAAHAWGALWANFQIDQYWTSPQRCAEQMQEAAQWAERAVLLDPDDALALTAAGHSRAYVGRQPEQGLILHERALLANPSLSWAWGYGAIAHCYLGDADAAFRYLDRHRRLAPTGTQADFFRGVRAVAHCLRGEWQGAVDEATMMVRRFPFFMNSRKILAAALGNLGRVSEARLVIAPVFKVEPDFSISRFAERYPMKEGRAREAIHHGLRRAGIAEEPTGGESNE